MLIDGQVAKEGCDVIFPHGFRMPFAVEQDEAAYPIDVDLLRPKAVMLDPEMPSNTVEKLGRRRSSLENPGLRKGRMHNAKPFKNAQ